MSSSEISSYASVVANSNDEAPLCHCSQRTHKCISWSDDNLGRRYFNCEDHGFVVWYDKAPPCLWQKQSLIESRDKIRRQTNEIKALRDAIGQISAELSALKLVKTTGPTNDLLKAIKDLVKSQNVDSEKKYRRFVVSTWGGFVVAAAVIVYILKN
ncbi:hypothetical protein DY000_02059704 [Brassica cretica]|uniref:DUF7900 domain-containing protein n=1 Tax=Brassica cretica TaxID=69181 RepID=A0ABQ7AU08_BRACR|nr:hypothetical protein DY000_02059704 [Brassica cretica]